VNPVLQSLKRECHCAAQHTHDKKHEQHFDQTVAINFQSELHVQSFHAWRIKVLAFNANLKALQVNANGAAFSQRMLC
jgi:hypothetical protein